MNTALLESLAGPARREAFAHAGPAEYRSASAGRSEQAPAGTPAPRLAVRSGAERQSRRLGLLRVFLVLGCVFSAVVAWFAVSGQPQPVEAELAVLLRGMGAIKGLLAVVAAAVVFWRFSLPVSSRAAIGYVACVWLLVGGSVLIWQLAYLSFAAVVFHIGWFVGLVIAWREGRQMLRFERQAPNPSIERTSQSLLRSL